VASMASRRMNTAAALVPLLPRHVLKDNWTKSMEKQNGKIIESAVEARGGRILFWVITDGASNLRVGHAIVRARRCAVEQA
jgi:hypothetical protein